MAFLVVRIERPLRASVSDMTLACVRFQVTKKQHSDPNIRNFVFTTGGLQRRMAQNADTVRVQVA